MFGDDEVELGIQGIFAFTIMNAEGSFVKTPLTKKGGGGGRTGLITSHAGDDGIGKVFLIFIGSFIELLSTLCLGFG